MVTEKDSDKEKVLDEVEEEDATTAAVLASGDFVFVQNAKQKFRINEEFPAPKSNARIADASWSEKNYLRKNHKNKIGRKK